MKTTILSMLVLVVATAMLAADAKTLPSLSKSNSKDQNDKDQKGSADSQSASVFNKQDENQDNDSKRSGRRLGHQIQKRSSDIQSASVHKKQGQNPPKDWRHICNDISLGYIPRGKKLGSGSSHCGNF